MSAIDEEMEEQGNIQETMYTTCSIDKSLRIVICKMYEAWKDLKWKPSQFDRLLERAGFPVPRRTITDGLAPKLTIWMRLPLHKSWADHEFLTKPDQTCLLGIVSVEFYVGRVFIFPQFKTSAESNCAVIFLYQQPAIF